MRTLFHRAALASAFGALLTVTAAVGAPAPAAPSALAGTMSSMQYLVGSWNCDVKVAASAAGPAGTDHGVVTYSVVPGNALHLHVTADDYAADSYSGYDEKTKTYWMSTIDAYGNASTETSADGKVFAGSSTGGGATTQIRDTFTRPASGTIRDLQEIQANGAWQTATDSTCTRR